LIDNYNGSHMHCAVDIIQSSRRVSGR